MFSVRGLFFLGLGDYFSHGAFRHDLVIRAETERTVEIIRKVRPRIRRNVARFGESQEAHGVQPVDDLLTAILPLQPLLHIPKDHQRYKAGGEMRQYSVVFLQIDRPRLKLRLHDAEALFDLPATLVDGYDVFYRVFQIRRHSVKPVILFFFPDPLFVERDDDGGNGVHAC